jgi:hypothetical protein
MPGQAGVPLLAVVVGGRCFEGVFATRASLLQGVKPVLVRTAHPFGRGPCTPRVQASGVLRAHDLGLAQHGVQQHIATGFDVLGLGIFDFVVADAVFAGDKNHAARGQAGGVDGIVTGT